MSDRDDIRQPADHLPPKEEQTAEQTADEPDYPTTDAPDGGSSVSPDTAAEPDKPARHGVDRLPPSGR